MRARRQAILKDVVICQNVHELTERRLYIVTTIVRESAVERDKVGIKAANVTHGQKSETDHQQYCSGNAFLCDFRPLTQHNHIAS